MAQQHESNKMEFTTKQGVQLAGYFNMVVRDAKTLEVKRETGWFQNLITDVGLETIGTRSAFSGCQVGTGSATPAVTDTILQARRAATSTQTPGGDQTSPFSTTSPYWSGYRRTYRFAEGVAAGNLTEVGMSITPSAPWEVFSRALILDNAGNPTTLTVLLNEVLDVTYELRTYLMETDSDPSVVNLLGVDYTLVMRGALISGGNQHAWPLNGPIQWTNIIAYANDMGPATGAPSGASSSGVGTQQPYIPGSRKARMTYNFNLTQGNIAGNLPHKSYRMTSPGGGNPTWQASISPPFPKTDSITMSLIAEWSWSRRTI